MKYSNEIVINLPRKKVIELFDNPDNLQHWQEGLQKFEHQSGEPGKPGAKSVLKYKHGKRNMELLETITVRNLPDEFSGTYEMKGAKTKVENFFYDEDADKTKWVSDTEFTGTGIVKIMLWLMPGSFKKQSYKFMQNFKRFAEEGVSVKDEK